MMAFRCVLRQKQTLNLIGGATESIFPKVEGWLQDGTDHWNALDHIVKRKDMGKYRSVVDFIFCELHPRMRKHAFAFYEDRGTQLRFMIKEKERTYFEARMLVLLEVAYAAFCEKRAMTWRGVVEYVESLEAA